MQLFISWSGPRSKALASALRDWLPLVIQSLRPWFSPDDIDKGAPWLAELNKQLQGHSAAIVCLTPENQGSAWLLFEAGAISKALESSRVCPVVLDMEPTDVKGPLAQFQATRPTSDEIRHLLGTLNKHIESPLIESHLDTLHEMMWPKLEQRLQLAAALPTAVSTPHRQPMDLIAEVLERVRGIERQITTPRSNGKATLQSLDELRSHLLDEAHELSLEVEALYRDRISGSILLHSLPAGPERDEVLRANRKVDSQYHELSSRLALLDGKYRAVTEKPKPAKRKR